MGFDRSGHRQAGSGRGRLIRQSALILLQNQTLPVGVNPAGMAFVTQDGAVAKWQNNAVQGPIDVEIKAIVTFSRIDLENHLGRIASTGNR